MRVQFACLALLCFALTSLAQTDRKVIVISLDGFPAYALREPRLPVPTLRRMMREGAYADTMQPINITVTWPNHTAMVTGVNAAKHGLLFNGLVMGQQGDRPLHIEPWHDKEEMVHAPTVYDLAYQAGLTTAQVDWVAIYRAKTIHWAFPEIPDPDGTVEKELIAQGVVTRDQLATFNDSSSAWRDKIRTDAVIDIVKQHSPNLLLLHLTDLDNINHRYGPMSYASYDSMELLDERIQQIVDAVRAKGDLDKTTFFIVSDHGFRTVKYLVHPNALLRRKGMIRGTGDGRTCDAWVVSEGGSAAVYLLNQTMSPEAIAALKDDLQHMEGVDHVYDRDEFGAVGLPTNAANMQSPMFWMTAKPDFSLDEMDTVEAVTHAQGTPGSHGYINSDPMMGAIFIAWGAGIRKGTHLNSVANVDVAPTVARILGLKMDAFEDNAVQQIIARECPRRVRSDNAGQISLQRYSRGSYPIRTIAFRF